jgi:hypothetical protein
MSAETSSLVLLCAVLSGSVLTGCAATSDSDPSESIDDQNEGIASANMTFAANFTQTVSGSFVGGARADVFYDASRLSTCRGNIGNNPGWTITAFYSANGITGNFPVAGQGLSNVPGTPGLTLPFSGDLAMWFQVTNAWGCSAYDSAYGANYHFNVQPPANAPGWVGNALALVDRATCNNGGPCYADATSLNNGVTLDTWGHQRAAIKQVSFDIWKQGVTDHVNPNLWQQLDVEVHSRVGSVAPFAMQYVNFAQYTGNNARYALGLDKLDPLPTPPGGAAVQNIAQCPAIPATITPDGQYVQADVELYFTANGVGLQPPGGGVYHAHFLNYANLYAVCNYPKL